MPALHMRQISEQEFREAIAATKKDAALVAAAKNDRLNSPENLYKEFEKLPVERRRDIIIAVANDYFVGAQWKIAFPLNNFAAAILPDAVMVAGKALFFTREEDSVREAIRAVRIYQNSPFFKLICEILGDAAEATGIHLASIATILTDPEIYGIVHELESVPGAERIVRAIGRIATYTKNLDSTMRAARFLFARRYSPHLESIASLFENSIFMARDPKSVRSIIEGLTAGSIDVVLNRLNGNKQALASIGDYAWKARNSKAIRNHLQSFLR
jgi:hypothetical protein